MNNYRQLSIKIATLTCAALMMFPLPADSFPLRDGDVPASHCAEGRQTGFLSFAERNCELTPQMIDEILNEVSEPEFSERDFQRPDRTIGSVMCICQCQCASCVTSCGACACGSCGICSSCGACNCPCCGGNFLERHPD